MKKIGIYLDLGTEKNKFELKSQIDWFFQAPTASTSASTSAATPKAVQGKNPLNAKDRVLVNLCGLCGGEVED